MITIWHKNSSASLRNCVQWLESHKIEYKTRDLRINPLTYNDIQNITKSKNFIELFSTRSRPLKNVNIYNLSYKEACNMLINKDNCLKTPIITNEQYTKTVIGYQDYELRTFIPKKERQKELKSIQKVLNNA